MKNFLLAALAASPIACRTTPSGDASVQSAVAGLGGGSQCTQSYADGKTVLLKVANDVLVVRELQDAADSFAGEYSLNPIALFVAPVEPVRYECEGVGIKIKVWEKLAYVNGKYFSLQDQAAPPPAAAGVNAQCTQAATSVGSVQIKVTEGVLRLRQLQGAADAFLGEYALQPVALFVAPVEPVRYECKQGQSAIKVWAKVASVNGQYYSMKDLGGGNVETADLVTTLQAISCVKIAEKESTAGIPENPGSGGGQTGNYIVIFKDGADASGCLDAIKAAVPGIKILDTTSKMALLAP